MNDSSAATLYVIQPDKTLKMVASGGSVDELKTYVNGISAALSINYDTKIKAVDSKLSGYVLTANAEDASTTDKLLKASSVSAVAKAYVDALDVAAKTATAA